MTNNINAVSALSSAQGISNSNDQKQKTKGAAQQFEALMIGELLKNSRSDSESAGWLGAGESDEAGSTALDYANQQFASVLAKNGGLGLATMITKDLDKQS